MFRHFSLAYSRLSAPLSAPSMISRPHVSTCSSASLTQVVPLPATENPGAQLETAHDPARQETESTPSMAEQSVPWPRDAQPPQDSIVDRVLRHSNPAELGTGQEVKPAAQVEGRSRRCHLLEGTTHLQSSSDASVSETPKSQERSRVHSPSLPPCCQQLNWSWQSHCCLHVQSALVAAHISAVFHHSCQMTYPRPLPGTS